MIEKKFPHDIFRSSRARLDLISDYPLDKIGSPVTELSWRQFPLKISNLRDNYFAQRLGLEAREG